MNTGLFEQFATFKVASIYNELPARAVSYSAIG